MEWRTFFHLACLLCFCFGALNASSRYGADGDDDLDEELEYSDLEASEEEDEGSALGRSTKSDPQVPKLQRMFTNHKNVFVESLESVLDTLDKDMRSGISSQKRKFKPYFDTLISKFKSTDDVKMIKEISDKRVVKEKKEAENDEMLKKMTTAKTKLISTVKSMKKIADKGTSIKQAYKKKNYLQMADDIIAICGALVSLCPHPGCKGAAMFFEVAGTMIALFNPATKPSIDQKLSKVANEIISAGRKDITTSFIRDIEEVKSNWDNVWSTMNEFGKLRFSTYKQQQPKVDHDYCYSHQKEMFGYVTDWSEGGYGKEAFRMLQYWAMYHGYRDKTVTRVLQLMPDPAKDSKMDPDYELQREQICTGQNSKRVEIFQSAESFFQKVDRNSILTLNYFYPPGFNEESQAISDVLESLFYDGGICFDDKGTEVTTIITMDPLGPPVVIFNDFYFLETGISNNWEGYPVWTGGWGNYGYKGNNGEKLGLQLTYKKFVRQKRNAPPSHHHDFYFVRVEDATRGNPKLGLKKLSLCRSFTWKKYNQKKKEKYADIRVYNKSSHSPYDNTVMGFNFEKEWGDNPSWATKNQWIEEFRIIKLKQNKDDLTIWNSRTPYVVGNAYGNDFWYKDGNYIKTTAITKSETKGSTEIDSKFIWYFTPYKMFYDLRGSGDPR